VKIVKAAAEQLNRQVGDMQSSERGINTILVFSASPSTDI
jgi:hypothetical protein